MSELVRRSAPPDRRTVGVIRRGCCPAGGGCRCCHDAAGPGHRDMAGTFGARCGLAHPNEDKVCRPPYPSKIPPCPERDTLEQCDPPGARPSQAACVECGRVTARRWQNPETRKRVAWCAGEPPAAPVEWPVPDPPTRAYNPQSQRHTWTRIREHHRVCGYCRIWVVNETENNYRWWQVWRWPDGTIGTNQAERNPRMPRCPGPPKEQT